MTIGSDIDTAGPVDVQAILRHNAWERGAKSFVSQPCKPPEEEFHAQSWIEGWCAAAKAYEVNPTYKRRIDKKRVRSV